MNALVNHVKIRPEEYHCVQRTAQVAQRCSPPFLLTQAETTMLKDVTQALQDITNAGSYSTRFTSAHEHLKLEVKGVGLIKLPVTATRARALIKQARQAPFGLRDKTLVDTSVRDVWQIAKSKLKIDKREWNKSLNPALAKLRTELGLPEGKLTASLDKLLIYATGQFFVPHQDSERNDTMLATLVVILPSVHAGGGLIISHQGEKKRYNINSKDQNKLTFLSFYADCYHEVRPIKQGYRIALQYNLSFEATADRPRLVGAMDKQQALVESAQCFFTQGPDSARHAASPTNAAHPFKRLVYLLDHEYSQRSLNWNNLKNSDSSRAEALQWVAATLGLDLHLALVEVQELWDCIDTSYSNRRHRSRRYRYYDDWEDDDSGDEDTNADANGYELDDLIDGSACLSHWLDQAGRTLSYSDSPVGNQELCWTKNTDQFDPFSEEYEGYMGNYGNTLDRLYHRAAIVAWPKAWRYAMLVKVNPEMAISELLELAKTDWPAAAETIIQQVLPHWQSQRFGRDPKLLISTLKLLTLQREPELAAQLLAPFSVSSLTPRAMDHFIKLLELYGAPWCEQIVNQWLDRPGHYDCIDWIKLLPRMSQKLAKKAGPPQRTFNAFMCRKYYALMKDRDKEYSKFRLGRELNADLPKRSKQWIALLEACFCAADLETAVQIVVHLGSEQALYPVELQLSVLSHFHSALSEDAFAAAGFPSLYQHSHQQLKQAIATGTRASDDWSLTVNNPCNCDDCTTMGRFLSAKTQQRVALPLGKDRRKHLHRQIGYLDIPVSHVTQRSGSPFSLVLTKSPTIFRSAAKQMKLRKAQWKELQGLAPASVA